MIPKFPDFVFINDEGLARRSKNNVLRSEMEVGPQKTRPIQSVPMAEYEISISICDEQLTAWRTWFQESIGSGSYWFLMNDPFDGVSRRFRFVDAEINWGKNGNLLQTTIMIEAYDEL